MRLMWVNGICMWRDRNERKHLPQLHEFVPGCGVFYNNHGHAVYLKAKQFQETCPS